VPPRADPRVDRRDRRRDVHLRPHRQGDGRQVSCPPDRPRPVVSHQYESRACLTAHSGLQAQPCSAQRCRLRRRALRDRWLRACTGPFRRLAPTAQSDALIAAMNVSYFSARALNSDRIAESQHTTALIALQ
jgi:hypothetical protein